MKVSRRLASGTAIEAVQWVAQPVSIEWRDIEAKGDPVARIVLDNDVAANLLITIAEEPPAPSRTPQNSAVISFFTWLPEYEALCTKSGVIAHLRSTGRFVWLYQPDVYGLVADASNRLRQRYEAEERDAQARARREQERFATERELRAPAAPSVTPALDSAAAVPAWAALKKKNASYFGYRLADGTVWVHFETLSGVIALRPLNLKDWENKVPTSLGRYDACNDVVLCTSPPSFTSVAATRISSQWADIESLTGLGWDRTGFFARSQG